MDEKYQFVVRELKLTHKRIESTIVVHEAAIQDNQPVLLVCVVGKLPAWAMVVPPKFKVLVVLRYGDQGTGDDCSVRSDLRLARGR